MFRTLLLALSLSALVLARPGSSSSAGQCNGSALCCNGPSYRADSSEGRALLSAFSMDADAWEGHKTVATNCGDDSGLLGIGGGSSCAQTPVCCEGNSIGAGSLIGIGIGCASIPISI